MFDNTQKRKGFTVGELLLLIVFLGVLIALIVPIFLTAREKAIQRSTIADMMMWGEAISSYITDHSKAPSNPRGPLRYKMPLIEELTPYFRAIRTRDWWGWPFHVWTGKDVNQYGIITKSELDFIIASFGKKAIQEYWFYNSENPEAGHFEIKEKQDFENDIVMWNNRFIRRPK